MCEGIAMCSPSLQIPCNEVQTLLLQHKTICTVVCAEASQSHRSITSLKTLLSKQHDDAGLEYIEVPIAANLSINCCYQSEQCAF